MTLGADKRRGGDIELDTALLADPSAASLPERVLVRVELERFARELGPFWQRAPLTLHAVQRWGTRDTVNRLFRSIAQVRQERLIPRG